MWNRTGTILAACLAVAAAGMAAADRNPISGVDWIHRPTLPQNLSFRQGLDGWHKEAPRSDAPDYAIRAVPDGPRPGLASALLTARIRHPHGYGTLIQGVRADHYRLRRVRLSALLRTAGVSQEAGLWLRLDARRSVHAWNMVRKPITGTTGWHRYFYVFDVPRDAQGMAFGSDLTGTGKVWIADVRLDPVGQDVALTPDSRG